MYRPRRRRPTPAVRYYTYQEAEGQTGMYPLTKNLTLTNYIGGASQFEVGIDGQHVLTVARPSSSAPWKWADLSKPDNATTDDLRDLALALLELTNYLG